jgi:thiosulfate/3-mercaptopyruvate sulfurtransferase
MVDLPTPLVDASELRRLLGKVRLLDARTGAAGRDAFDEAHLLGAVHADLDRDLAAPAPHPEHGGRHPLPDLQGFARTLGAWGIGPDTPVVVYDDQGGALAAARAWWLLRAVGHERAAVLDGGWQAAVAAGLPTSSRASSVEPRGPYPTLGWQLPTADADAVDLRRTDPSFVVLDVRSGARFRGDVEPIDPVAGHIPGAVNVPFAQNLQSDGRFASPADLAATYSAVLGDRSPDRLVVHCGSGVTACHTLLALERAGLGGAALYVGSFGEWCRQGRPVARDAI